MSKTSVISSVFLSLLPWVAFAQSGSEPPAVSRARDDAAALAAPEITPQMYGAKRDGKSSTTRSHSRPRSTRDGQFVALENSASF